MMKWIIIIVAFVGGLYSFILDVVSHRSANNPTPESVSDVYDEQTYAKWKKYKAEHSRLSLVSGVVTTLISIVMLFTNVYSAFAALFPSGFFWQLFAVILLELSIGTVVGIVRDYISTMIIEEKYGFNRSSMKTFIFDIIRSLLVGLSLSLGLSWLMGVLHMGMGNWLIVLFAGVMFAFTMLVTFLYPIFSRIGNKFTPLEEGELKDRLMELLTKHGYKVKAIEVMDASRRTTKLNAYFTGFGKLKTIVLFDNLVNAMTPDEICAVFAHELGHGLNKDVLKQQIMNIGNLFLMAFTVWVAVSVPSIYTDFGFGEINYGFAFIIVSIFLSLVNPFSGMLRNAYSRKAEYKADKQAVDEGYGEALVTALKKLSRDNFAHLSPSKINVVLEYSHPPLAERIEAIEKLMKK